MFIIDDILKGLAQRKAGKEQARAGEQQAQANYDSQVAAENNAEDSRLARMGYATSQLTGNRAMTPEQIAAIMKRRAITARKGAVVDPSKGAMFGALGNAASSAGNLATSYIQGLGLEKMFGGAQPTSLLPQGSNIDQVAKRGRI